MITLSYSTIEHCLQPNNSHNWINKQMGRKVPENEYMREGRRIHKIIQEHISGKVLRNDLSHIKHTFPIVEEVDFDERCHFIKPVLKPGEVLAKHHADNLRRLGAKGVMFARDTELKIYLDSISKYWVHGYIDADNPEEKKFGEIKSAGTMWSIGDFVRSNQRRVYAWVKEDYKWMIGITAIKYDDKWSETPPKSYPIPLTQKDREQALKWIWDAVALIEKGSFKGGLDENGKCTLKFCNYGDNCAFK